MAKRLNIIVDQGADFIIETTVVQDDGVTPFDVTAWTITGSLATDYGVAAAGTFTITKTSAANGQIKIALPASVTNGLTPANFLYGPPSYVYDVKMTDGSETKRILHGHVTVNPKVT